MELVGLGSACEYQSPDEKVLRENIELTKKFIVLSHDVGGSGVKVRPNRFNNGEERETTVARIGMALRECGKFAADYFQEIRVEVHGRGTSDPMVMHDIMGVADHPCGGPTNQTRASLVPWCPIPGWPTESPGTRKARSIT